MEDLRIIYKTEPKQRGIFREDYFAIVQTVSMYPKMGIAIVEEFDRLISVVFWSPIISHDLVRFYRAVRILHEIKNNIGGDQKLLFAAYGLAQKKMNDKTKECMKYLSNYTDDIEYFREEVLKETISAELLNKMLRNVRKNRNGRVSYLKKYADEGIITNTSRVQNERRRNERMKREVWSTFDKIYRKRTPIDDRLKYTLKGYGVEISKLCYATRGSYNYFEDYDEVLIHDSSSQYCYYDIFCEGPDGNYIGHPLVEDENLGEIILEGYMTSPSSVAVVSYIDPKERWVDIIEIEKLRPIYPKSGSDLVIEHNI